MNYTIETHHLKKIYKDKVVVNDVNIHVKKGEIYGFVGQNGAGKSTLMKMLLHLVQANAGEIIIFGNRVVENDFEMLKCVGLLKDADKKVSQYSLGMKQRLAIARAILTKPELLILDEPINALDLEGIREMRELFRKLNTDYGTTIFISSHILSEVEQIADTIGIIQNGKLIKETSMSDVHKYQTDYVEVDVDNVELAGYILESKLISALVLTYSSNTFIIN